VDRDLVVESAQQHAAAITARAMLETCGSAGLGCTFPVIIWSLKQ
jgi:hypothetical protein